jgi:2-polyprenyl-6-methoxyphenol hydroxylase-like FAD-dependent oxidoreductase
MVKHTWDVAVAGGGPAGLAAAIAARRKGLSVAVFEGVLPAQAIDKCCGEGLMPEALEALDELGIDWPTSVSMPIAGVRFLECGHAAAARFAHQLGAGVRRTTLHSILMEHARDAGVSVFWGTPVRGLAPSGILAGDEEIACRWIVGADGSQSGMRRAAGLESPSICPRRFGLRRHFRIEPWTDLVEAHWAHGVQAFVTPVAENEVDVAMLSSDPQLRYQDALLLFPELTARLKSAATTSTVRGAVTASRRLDRVATHRLVLLGDASGSVDSVTGLGLCMAFQQAVALGEALAREDLTFYATQHDRLARRPRVMESVMLAMNQRDNLRRRAIRVLEAEPAHFSRLLSVHTGASSALSFALRAPLALGWRFLTV